MPPKTVTERLRSRLRDLLRHAPRGTQAAIARFSAQRGRVDPILPQDLTYFLTQTEGRNGIQLDDLDDIADYFNISIGELVGDTKMSELHAEEQRVVYAFRALPAPTRHHFLAILEAASLFARVSDKRVLKPLESSGKTPAFDRGMPDAGAGPHLSTSALADLRQLATVLSIELAKFASRAKEFTALPAAKKDKP